MTSNGEVNGDMSPQSKKVFFFDIDNCRKSKQFPTLTQHLTNNNPVYSKSFKISDLMGELIDSYFQTHLAMSKEDANYLHHHYYKEYGLAIEGLVHHHKIDPLEYNEKVDDALPLDELFKPDLKLRKLLERIDRSKVKVWLFTNAYITHGKRVVKLLDIEDQFEGITYCDYGAEKLLCKPAREMFVKAMRESGATDPRECYYVDDSGLNARAGKEFGWTSAHLVEPIPGHEKPPKEPVADFEIQSLYQLPEVFPELFRPL